MKKVIGVAGQMQNGKDTVANYLAANLSYDLEFEGNAGTMIRKSVPWRRAAFATEVKRVFCDTFDVDLDFIEEWKVKPEIPPGFDMPVRQALQFIGDGFRRIRGNIWIELAFRNVMEPTVFSDVRYINELDVCNKNDGITILVWRPGSENDDPNGSEAQIRPLVDWFAATGMEGPVISDLSAQCCASIPEDCLKVDLFLRNEGPVEALYEKIKHIVIPYVKRKYSR